MDLHKYVLLIFNGEFGMFELINFTPLSNTVYPLPVVLLGTLKPETTNLLAGFAACPVITAVAAAWWYFPFIQ